ncbi:MAG: prepilin-type N-terminal cleavage/methylation domain-containing protein [Chitinimonas sp.]|nr:prepilin-type N-terminal cleavage/methylation domain-containing protein [Chitinimonas sp.]
MVTPMRHRGFTLLELMIAMAIVATLLSIVAPRYLGSVDRAKETVLQDDLHTMRKVLDQFHADRGRYPNDLEELVSARYLRSIPVDPLTERNDTWRVEPPPPGSQGNVGDVRSGASGRGSDGRDYGSW